MICPTCDGSGESSTGWSGEGRCWRCRGAGEIPDVCEHCGDEVQCNDDGICASCVEMIAQEKEEDEEEARTTAAMLSRSKIIP